MTIAQVSNQLLRSQGNDTTTVAANYPITGDGSTQLPLGLAEDYRGADGESLAFNIADITDGHRVNISGSQGSSSFDVLNGQDGANGVNGVNGADGQSVTFDINNIVNGHRVTLSGAQVSTSFDVMNGDDGVDGISPAFRFVENEDSVIVFVSGAQGEESFTLYNTTGGEGATYSAGPNINITDNTISGRDWTDELNAKLDTTAFSLPNSANWDDTYNTVNSNSAQWANDTTYTAGSNIDITNNLISGKDWTAEIESAISSVSSNYYPMTGNPSGFLTAHQDISNLMQKSESANFYPMTGNPSGFLTAIDLSNYYTKNETSSRDEISDAIATIPGAVDYSAGTNIDITNHIISGKDWTDTITAASAYAASQAQGTEYTAGANIDITNHIVSGKDWSNEITAASAYAASQGKTYTGVAPIIVNNSEDKISANCIELSAGNGIDSNLLAIGTIAVSGGTGGGVAISGQYKIDDSTVTADCSAFCMYEQANSTGSYQLMATANNASWHGYGYTMSRPENLLMDNVSSVAQNYAASAVSSHVRLMNYPDITFSAVHNTFKAGGIVVPYETTQGYGTFYNFVASSVSADTSAYKFNYIGTNGYATTLTVSSHYNGAETGVYRDYKRIFLSPSESECKVVIVATSGDIPASGATDNKLYVVTGA